MTTDKLFGFSLKDRKIKKAGKIYSPAPPTDEDGISTISVGGYYGHYLDIEGTAKNEFDLVKKYREVSLHPEVDSAIDEIVNEVIASDLDYSPVDIELSNLQLSDKIKKSIHQEFDYILRILNFNKNCHTIFRRWYVDGKIFYHKIIDFDNPKEGIQELRFIDPLKIKKVREKLKKEEELSVFGNNDINKYNYGKFIEYFVYSDKGFQGFAGQGIKIASDAITFVPSGLMDYNRNLVLSYIHKSIKAVNQLRMIEDSLVIYRLSRAPERRIFYIDVGNLPKIKAEQYLKEVMSRYRNKLVYDSCLTMDTEIPLLDGRNLTLNQIAVEFNKGERLWTYSCNPNTGKFAPGIISWAGVTRKDQKVVKITLDNDKSITCTLDHKFPVWNKGKVEAKDLQVGDSMIPFYSRKKQISNYNKNSTYLQIFENESQKWKFVHRLVSEWKDENDIINDHNYNPIRINEERKTVHHINYDRYNNKEYKNSFAYKNHKIKSIEFLEDTIDVGTLAIDREEIYHNYHTFALDAGIYTCNSTGEIRDDRKHMSMLEDFWLPRREGGRGTEITTLPGGQNLGELADVQYFKEKLYSSLNLPISRLESGNTFNLGRTTEITRDELKFSKFVGRLRKKFSEIFQDILRTQLILKGIITTDDWENIKENIQYDYIYDNHFSELKNIEMLKERMESVSLVEPYIGKYFSHEYIRKQLLKQTDREIEEIDIRIKNEKKLGLIIDPNEQSNQQNQSKEFPVEVDKKDGEKNDGKNDEKLSDLDDKFKNTFKPTKE